MDVESLGTHPFHSQQKSVSYSVLNLHLLSFTALLNLMNIFLLYFIIFDYAMDSTGSMVVVRLLGLWLLSFLPLTV